MTETPILSLPLLQPAQAQKHVTVNEALARVDGVARLTLGSVSQTTPPAVALDGEVYAVPPGAVNAWAGQDGAVAIAINGGWEFVSPRVGWRAMVVDQGAPAIWDGQDWRVGAVTLTPNGASFVMKSVEVDVTLSAGASVSSPVIFPSRAIAYGVTGRVTATITGSATGWELGVSGDTARYGSGLGLSQNSWINGPSTPLVYWSPTALEITATGGSFAGGALRLVAHYAELWLPEAV